jgi:hypothetical protein
VSRRFLINPISGETLERRTRKWGFSDEDTWTRSLNIPIWTEADLDITYGVFAKSNHLILYPNVVIRDGIGKNWEVFIGDTDRAVGDDYYMLMRCTSNDWGATFSTPVKVYDPNADQGGVYYNGWTLVYDEEDSSFPYKAWYLDLTAGTRRQYYVRSADGITWAHVGAVQVGGADLTDTTSCSVIKLGGRFFAIVRNLAANGMDIYEGTETVWVKMKDSAIPVSFVYPSLFHAAGTIYCFASIPTVGNYEISAYASSVAERHSTWFADAKNPLIETNPHCFTCSCHQIGPKFYFFFGDTSGGEYRLNLGILDSGRT